MAEPRSDRVRGAFAALTADADAHVRPPGVESVRETVRRRRNRRVAGGTLLTTLAITGLLVVPRATMHAPLTDDSPSPTPSAAPTATLSPSPWPTVTLVPPSPGQPTPTSTGLANPSAVPGTQGPGVTGPGVSGPGPAEPPAPDPKPTQTQPPSCLERGYVWITDVGGGELALSGVEDGQIYYRICPGETIRVFWATYEIQADGSQTLHDSQTFTLTYANPTVHTTPRSPATCSGDTFIVSGNTAIRATIPAGVRYPYPGFRDGVGGMISQSTGMGC